MADFVFQENASISGATNISSSQLIKKENSSSSVKFRVGVDFEINIESTAEYYDSEDNLLLDGKIKTAKELSYDPFTGSRIYEITIYDNAYNLIDGNLNEVYRDKTPEEIIELVVEAFGLTFNNLIPSSSGIEIPKKVYLDRDPIDSINELSKTLGANWRVLGSNFYLFRRGDTLSPITINGNEGWAINKDGWIDDTDKKTSTVIIKGAVILQRTSETVTGTGTEFILSRTPVDVEIEGFTQTTENINGDYEVDKQAKKITFNTTQTDPEIVYSYESQVRAEVGDGDPTRVLNKSYIESNIEARKLGRKYVEIYGDGIQKAVWINNDMYSMNLNNLIVGQKIKVINRLNTNRNGEYIITRVVRKYPNQNQITVGEDETSIYNWQSESKDRIKQLEEKDQNSDFSQKDVFKTGKVKVKLTATMTKYLIVENTGEILWSSDTSLSNNADVITDDGLIAHYKMNDNLATTEVIDSMGLANGSAERNTNLLSTTGKIDNALHFNGVVDGNFVSHWKLNGDVTDSQGSNDGTLSTATVIDSMDSTTGWVTANANTYISTNTTTKQEGTGAMNLYNTVATTDLSMNKTFTPVDYTGKVINYYIYFKDQDVLDHLSSTIGIFYLMSATGFYRFNMGAPAELSVGWNVLTADADNPTSSSGTPDITQINKIQFSIEGEHPGAQIIEEGDLIIDYINYGTPMKCKNMLEEENHAYLNSGEGSHINCGTVFNAANDWSMSMWANAKGPSQGSYSSEGTLFTAHITGGPVHYWNYNDNRLYLVKSGEWIAKNYVTLTRDWHHITLTYDASETTTKTYVDGVLEATTSDLTFSDTSSTDFFLGNRGSSGHNFHGELDDVRAFNRTLDLTEVKSIYNQGTVTYEHEDYIELDSSIEVPSNSHSVAFWYKTEDSKFQMLFQQYNNSTSGNIELRPSDNTLGVESRSNNFWDEHLVTGIDVDDGEWHHYCLVFSPSDTRLYVDGVLSDTTTSNTDTQDFRYRVLGGHGNTTYTYGQAPHGDMDDVRIYKAELTSTQVSKIYNSGNGTEEENIAQALAYDDSALPPGSYIDLLNP